MSTGDNVQPEWSSIFRDAAGAAPERLFAALYDQLHNLAGRVRFGRAGETAREKLAEKRDLRAHG